MLRRGARAPEYQFCDFWLVFGGRGVRPSNMVITIPHYYINSVNLAAYSKRSYSPTSLYGDIDLEVKHVKTIIWLYDFLKYNGTTLLKGISFAWSI